MCFVRSKQRWLNWKFDLGLLAFGPHFYPGTNCLFKYKYIYPSCCMTNVCYVYIPLKMHTLFGQRAHRPEHWSVRTSYGSLIQLLAHFSKANCGSHIFPKVLCICLPPRSGSSHFFLTWKDHSLQIDSSGFLQPFSMAIPEKKLQWACWRLADTKLHSKINKD